MKLAMFNRRQIFRPFTAGLLAVLAIWPNLFVFAQDQTAKPDTIKTTGASVPVPSAARLRTVEELQSEIRGRLLRPELRRGQVGVKVVSLNTGKVVFEENAEKYFMPASNMKNFTVAAALEKLTPDFRFVTSVYAVASPDTDGTVKGDLRIFGRGDVSISTAFSEGNYYKKLDELTDKIYAAGVRRIEGSIVADDSYFVGNPVPPSWEWDDLQWYYGAEISALPLNDNAIDLVVTPGPAGYPCSAKLSPFNPVYRVKNTCLTTAAGTPRTLKIDKQLGQNQLEISGTLPVGNAGFSGAVTVSRPAELFAALLKQRLELKGITVTGQYSVRAREAAVPAAEQIEIAKLESPPLSLIAAKTMKPSQNMYTETLLWTLGEHERARLKQLNPPPAAAVIDRDSSTLGIDSVKAFLTGIGIAPDAVVHYDGSGMSRHNLITPTAVVQLYGYMAKSKYAQAWKDSLTIGGVDGTLARRFRGTAAAGNIRGKTGTIDQVSALSGYMTTAGGDQLIVSFVVNGVAQSGDRVGMIDDIVLSLAKFNGKID